VRDRIVAAAVVSRLPLAGSIVASQERWQGRREHQAANGVKPDLQQQVIAARSGDLLAFEQIVARYQDHVTGIAFSWLGDIEQSRDVAQEAFFEAYLHLHQLEQPAAFAGWLRRIVIKCCDRVTRRRQLVEPGAHVPEGTSRDDPAEYAQQEQAAAQLRYAISALPEPLRLVIALAYFADASGDEIAAFLDLPITTVKKRLFDARRKLREEGQQLMQQTIKLIKPSASSQFSEETLFFIAMREQNLPEIKRLLARSPTLANAEQNWSHELAHQRVLPFANRATALIAAIELDNMDILDLLLASGADPNGRCGCATGEPAVWAAALFNRPRALSRLIDAGADVNIVSAAGNTPLHVAAMRGYADIVRRLLAAGADPTIKDRGVEGTPPLVTAMPRRSPGRTPGQCARVAGFVELANEIDGTTNAFEVPEVCRMRRCGNLLETGIRAIDFFAPLESSGLVRLQFGAGVGMLIMLGELALRAHAANFGVVWTGFAQPPFDTQDVHAEFAELGLTSAVSSHLASFNASPDEQRAMFESGLRHVERLRETTQQVLVIVQSTQGFEQDVDASFPRLLDASRPGAVSTIVIAPFKDAHAPFDRVHRPYTTQWVLDRDRSNKRLYPAIDTRLSLSSTHVSARHDALRSVARDIIAAYREKDPHFAGFDSAVSGLGPGDELAHRLLRRFAQPLSIAMPFGGAPGEHTSLGALLDEVEVMLDGTR
jgi:RNA polymerase sigma factor (sigma-70 family)